MNDIRFSIGDEVRVVRDIRSDGSNVGYSKGDLLVREGEIGIVRHVGYWLQDQVIFRVYFLNANMTIGVRDKEVISAQLAWCPTKYYRGQTVQLTLDLRAQGEMIARRGDDVQVIDYERDLATGDLNYKIALNEFWINVADRALSSSLS
ncbi:nitrogen fixation protein NifZ [Photobacterium sp. ZSDE20]|uniref:Nitrogen fixation protein NifZ n=1 Tax=Photobacterium pectinilyticum TaxID=2906793 RepID=A0ABT1N213_9GAMM|nr:nitrogen fixation protein NifZ [Photobacterium sp. ZSDE20]MCQ1058577.1 nitrogen fixation protein NifZ [Photobacterium sp. ZSDE20]MDD1826302.1 nitrogen fixation protein NifZ [Photobacterium sp. ZSDE20]